jgi:Cu(I)/Ag(I) efflux system membrane protein CusA/SilA
MIFSAIITAFGGGFILLSFFSDVQLSVAVWVGFIALFGIATDDGVLIATFLNKTFSGIPLESKQQIQKLTIEAGKKRIRACLMTTATTLIALLPVLSSSGKGSEIMIPMAIPIFGGMLASLISLFIVPVFYAWRAERKLKYLK